MYEMRVLERGPDEPVAIVEEDVVPDPHGFPTKLALQIHKYGAHNTAPW
jgi:hypothetical protein